jgi:ankyrin repeat protein
MTALIYASWYGHHDTVRNLLEGGGDINAKSTVRNQMMNIILLTIYMMMMMMIIINVEDRDVCR